GDATLRSIIRVLLPGLMLMCVPHARADATHTVIKPGLSDPVADSLTGVWTSSTDPRGAIRIDASGYGVITVVAEDYDAVGFYGADGFSGVTRTPGLRRAGGQVRFGTLRFQRVGSDRIDAELTDPRVRPPARVEHWTFVSRFGGGPVSRPP